jgi:hypothetical protein
VLRTLPCVLHVAVRGGAAVRHALPCGWLCRALNPSFAVCRPQPRTAKKPASILIPPWIVTGGRHVASLPCVCTRQSDQMVLCRVHTHGKEAPVFQIFLFFFQSLHFKMANTYISIHITSNTCI